jgi:hypothetical protein
MVTGPRIARGPFHVTQGSTGAPSAPTRGAFAFEGIEQAPNDRSPQNAVQGEV